MSNARSPSTTTVAAAAAEAVRELNHRTQGPTTLTGPAELNRLVAELAVMTARLPQLLRQLGDWLQTEHDAGRVRSDNHIDPGRLVDHAAADLADAGHCARGLGRALDAAHQHTTHLGARPADHAVTAADGPQRPTASTGQEPWPPVGTFMATSGQDSCPPVGRSRCPLTSPSGAHVRVGCDGIGR